MFKTLALVVVAAGVGSMAAAAATPKLMTLSKLDAKHTSAVNIGITAGAATVLYGLLASVV